MSDTPTVPLPVAWQPFAKKTDESQPPAAQPMKSLVSKLAEVMAAVQRIAKRGKNDFHGYHYATEADIAETIRMELASRQVILVPAIVGEQRVGIGDKGSVLTILDMEMEFLDGENRESIKKPWKGYGSDKDDKGGYKAMTGAEKYFLLKTFLIPTGDDPERDDGGKQKTKPDAASVKAAIVTHPSKPITDAMKAALPDGAVLLVEVKPGFEPAVAALITHLGEELPLFRPPHVQIAEQACYDCEPVILTIKAGNKTGKPYVAAIRRVRDEAF